MRESDLLRQIELASTLRQLLQIKLAIWPTYAARRLARQPLEYQL